MLYRSNILAQASGALNGNVFSHNRFGMYIRNRSLPVNPNTDRQQEVRGNMISASSKWHTMLNGSERDSWNNYAAEVPRLNPLGDSNYLTGFNWFVGSAAARLQAGYDPVATGPALHARADTDTSMCIIASAASGEITVNFDGGYAWLNETGGGLTVFSGVPQAPTRNFFGGPWRFAGVIDGNDSTPPTSPATVTAPYQMQAGQKLYVKCRILRADGRYSSWFYDHVIVST